MRMILKKLCIWILCVLLLCGCAAVPAESGEEDREAKEPVKAVSVRKENGKTAESAKEPEVRLVTKMKERSSFEKAAGEGRKMSSEETDAWQAFFSTFRMPAFFLKTEFESPEKADLGILLYNGLLDQNEEGEYLLPDWPEEEKKETEARLFPDKAEYEDLARITRAQLDAFLMKYIGMTTDQTEKIHLDWLAWDEQTDSYYLIIPDAADIRYRIIEGAVLPDGRAVVHWQATLGLSEKENARQGYAVLRQTDDAAAGFSLLGKKWVFESNGFEDNAGSLYTASVFLCTGGTTEEIDNGELRKAIEDLMEGGNPMFPYIGRQTLVLSGGTVTVRQIYIADGTLEKAAALPQLQTVFSALEAMTGNDDVQLEYAVILAPDEMNEIWEEILP